MCVCVIVNLNVCMSLCVYISSYLLREWDNEREAKANAKAICKSWTIKLKLKVSEWNGNKSHAVSHARRKCNKITAGLKDNNGYTEKKNKMKEHLRIYVGNPQRAEKSLKCANHLTKNLNPKFGYKLDEIGWNDVRFLEHIERKHQ